jgi:hypothetical protein
MKTSRTAFLVLAMSGAFSFQSVSFAQTEATLAEEVASTSPKEKMQFVQTAIDQMKTWSGEVEKLLSDAEKDKDDIRVQCLNKKLTTMRTLLEITQAAKVTMSTALSAGENERAEHEYRKIRVALDKSQQYRVEADACIGVVNEGPGSTAVTVTGAGLISDKGTEDPFAGEDVPEIDIEGTRYR